MSTLSEPVDALDGRRIPGIPYRITIPYYPVHEGDVRKPVCHVRLHAKPICQMRAGAPGAQVSSLSELGVSRGSIHRG